jgi:hypothetical protein
LPGANGVSGYLPDWAQTAPFDAVKNRDLDPILLACEAGKVPVAGGYQLLNPAAQALSVISSAPVNDQAFKGWRVDVKNVYWPVTLKDASVAVFVVCAQMAQ